MKTAPSRSRAGKKLAKLVGKQMPSEELPKALRAAATDNHVPEGADFARQTGLRYVSDHSPGIRREGHSVKTFRYRSATGREVKDAATLRRIRSLVIPPAWKDVWICPVAEGHIQATGVDAKGRKQYRYHAHWRAARDETKFHRMIAFGKALPGIRRRTAKHLKMKGLPREKVLAAVVQLLEKTLIRVGNSEYARDNHSYGLTTILDKHVQVKGRRVHFEFTGKSGVDHAIDLEDPRLAPIVKACQDLPGQELFAYTAPDGHAVDVTSADVNGYLKEITGEDFTAKDFRTWNATVLAAKALKEIASFDSQAQAKKNVIRAVEEVAKRLGNTRSVCRKCYIHPAVIDAYMDGSLLETLAQRARAEMKELGALRPAEAAVLAFLQERLRREAGGGGGKAKRKTQNAKPGGRGLAA
ncbi:MAG TPA: DNA topoisomerase IB [Phycisphaerae bacterium]|nr:DNA topoisomerase IB [Phycisphaerae bacterium]